MFTLHIKAFLLVLSPYSTVFSNAFLSDTPSISNYRHHTIYTTEPSTVNNIFLRLSHYEHPQVLPVNRRNIVVLSRIMSTVFFFHIITL